MMSQEKALRKAAILIDTLETERADALLEQMPPQQQAVIRNLIVQLDDVSDAEREEIIAEFRKAEGTRPAEEPQESEAEAAAPPSEDVWLEIGNEPVAAERRDQTPEVAAESERPAAESLPVPGPRFAFLEESQPEELAECFRDENTQAVAIVMSHLSPKLAARVVSCFSSPTQTDVLQRLSELTDAQPDILDDLELHLRAKMIRQNLGAAEEQPEESVGQVALRRILDEADDELRENLRQHLEGNPAHESDKTSPQRDVPESPAERLVFEMEQDSARSDANFDRDEFSGEMPAHDSFDGLHSSSPTGRYSPWDFDDLAALDDATFVGILERVDPAVVLIALTSASDDVLDKLLRQLPRRQARDLRCRLEQIGPLRLVDIDEAQRQIVASAAEELNRFRPAA